MFLFDVLVFLGMETPLKRFFVGFTGGFLYQYMLRPRVSYYEHNKAKPFILTDRNGTFVPWWSWPLIGGGALALFL